MSADNNILRREKYIYINELFHTKLKKTNIDNNNYQLYTITSSLTNYKEQKEQLKNYITNQSFPFIATLEFSDNKLKAKGWHLHIVSHKQPSINKGIYLHTSEKKGSLNIAISYISKQTKHYKATEKDYFYNCTHKQNVRSLITGELLQPTEPTEHLKKEPIYIDEVEPPLNYVGILQLLTNAYTYVYTYVMTTLQLYNRPP